MKSIFTVVFSLFIGSILFSQTSNLIFFSENGERFHVVLNGARMTDDPQTNVTLEGKKSTQYHTKIIFEDVSINEISKKISLIPGMEMTYVISPEEGSILKEISKGKKNAKFKLKLFSSTRIVSVSANSFDVATTPEPEPEPVYEPEPVAQPVTPPPPAPAPIQTHSVTTYVTPPPPVGTTVTTTETYSTNGAPIATHEAMSLNMNLGGVNLGAGFSVNGGIPPVSTSTTTVQTTETYNHNHVPVHSPPPPPPVVYVHGYTGPVGCPAPMSPSEFANLRSSVGSRTFSDTKMSLAKQVVGTSCITTSQARQLVELFDFESDRLEFAKYAYGSVYDLGNYYRVGDAFDFDSSVNELNRYIGGR